MRKRAWYFGGAVNTRRAAPSGRSTPTPETCAHPDSRREFSTGFRTDDKGARYRMTHARCARCGEAWLHAEEPFPALTPAP
jgi:hypothetical protein